VAELESALQCDTTLHSARTWIRVKKFIVDTVAVETMCRC
jgi:hypothetical protein